MQVIEVNNSKKHTSELTMDVCKMQITTGTTRVYCFNAKIGHNMSAV